MKKNHYLFLRTRLFILSLSVLFITQVRAQVCTALNVPYTQDFESVTTPAIPTCNTIQNPGTGNDWITTLPFDYDFNSNALTYEYSSSDPADAWYYTQGLNLTAGVSYRLTYRYGCAGYEEKLRVSYGSAAVNTAMTHTLTNHPSIVNDVTSITQVIDFTPATTGVYYIGFNAYSDANQFDFFVDDISVTLSPTCITPTSLAFTTIASASASLSWTAGGAETAWDVYYGLSPLTAPVAGTIPTATTSTTSFTLTGLTSSTAYSFYVRAHCSASDQSVWSNMKSFTTVCTATNIPYVQDFESVTTPAIPSCNSVENVGTGNTWITSSPAAYGFTTKALRYIYDFSNPANTWFYTQGLNLTGGVSYRITYKYGTSSSSSIEKLKVNYGLSPAAAAMTGTISNHPSITNSSALTNVVDFTPSSTGVYYIGFNAYSTANQYSLFVDDITVNLTPSCIPPTALTTVNTTTNSTTLNWTAPSFGTPGNYVYEVRTSGAAGSGATGLVTTATITASSTSVTVTGLSANTSYSVYIQSNCGAGNLSAWSPATAFTTPCLATNIPYLQDFESITTPAIPACNSVQNVGTGNIWATTSPAAYGFTTKALWYVYNSTNAANTWFYTQGLNLTGGVSYRITYKYGTSSTSSVEKLKVNYGSGALATAMTNTISNHSSISNSTALTNVVDFTPASTGVYYIGFNAYSTANQYSLFVDDITVNLSPTCTPPTALVASNTTYSSTTLSWTAPALGTPANYVYEVRTSGAAGSGATGLATTGTVTAPSTSVTVTGLSSATNYSLYVQSNCGAGDLSAWTSFASFSTPCQSPNITGVTGATRCGVGTVNLGVTGDAGATFNWYAASTGGTPLATGTTFTTPSISSTTNFYVSASTPPTIISGGLAAPSPTISNDNSYGYDGLEFDATSAFTINSVVVYPTGAAGNLVMRLVNGIGTVINTATIAIPAGTGTVNPTPFTVPLNFAVTPGTDYRLVTTSSPFLLYHNNPATYPVAIGTLGSITNSFFYYFGSPVSSTSDYNFFYNWQVSSVCESPRTMVTATVTTPPVLSVTSGTTVCANVVATASITSTLSNYNSYVWAPSTNLYTDAAGTTAYTGGTATTVYYKSSTGGTTHYTVTANNSSSQCSNVANANFSVDMPAITVMSSASVICVGTTATLTAQSAPASLGVGALTTTGSGSSGTNYVSPYGHYYGGFKGQYLFTAAELSASGVIPGNITSLALNVTAAGTTYNGFAINMAATAQTALTNTFVTPVTSVYAANATPVVGVNTYNFTSPFNWNGTSNVVVEITWSNNNGGGTAAEVTYDATSFVSSSYYVVDNQTPATVATRTIATGVLSFRPSMKLVSANPNYTWQWNPGAINSNTTTVTPNVTVSTPLSYTVSVVNAATTCSNTAVLTVTANPTPTVTASSSAPSICSGNSTTLTAIGATTYTWMPAGGSAATTTVTPAVSRVYTVTGTSLGCSDTKTVSITVTPTPTLTTVASPSVICAGATVSLTATGAANYTWTPGSILTGTTTVTPTASTVYSVTGVTSGCASTKTVNVTVNNVPVVNLNPSTTICTTGGSATLTASGTSTAYVWSNGPTTATNVVTPITATSYTVTGTNSCGSTTATTSVALGSAPTLSASTSASTICKNNSAVLTASGTATSYTWSTGATSLSITVSPTVTTLYIVTSTNACGTASATVVQTVDPCTGLEETFNSDAVSIYPNPANEFITIAIPASLASSTTLVEVTDAIGKLVMKETLNTDVTTINLNKLEDGVYFFKVISNNQTVKVGKVVKH